ncbi:MAG: hypothetical protein ACRDZZ_08885 [Ilumatobacteraceae bacterium]
MTSLPSRTIVRLALGAAAAIAPLTVGSATANATSSDGLVRALEHICEAQGGTAVHNPFQLVRCQSVPEAPHRTLVLRVAEFICERPIGGTFGSAPSFGSTDGSITWVCV